METEKYLFEQWRDIRGYEGLYQVSNFGRVRSLDVLVDTKWGNHFIKKGRALKPSLRRRYLGVTLTKDKRTKTFSVHRLVATAFIPNPNNLPQINHKDENPLNNFVYIMPDGNVDESRSNLEWCTSTYNLNYGTRGYKIGKRNKHLLSKKILQFTLNKTFIKTWESASDIQRDLGFSQSNVSKCCRGKIKTAYGYVWRFA